MARHDVVETARELLASIWHRPRPSAATSFLDSFAGSGAWRDGRHDIGYDEPWQLLHPDHIPDLSELPIYPAIAARPRAPVSTREHLIYA